MSHEAVRYTDGIPARVADMLTAESALQIRINSVPYTLTMRTPGDDEYLTKGLLFTEGVIEDRSDIDCYRETTPASGEHGSCADVSIPLDLLRDLDIPRRTMMSSASCGVCGKADLSAVNIPDETLCHDVKFQLARLPKMFELMQARQTLFRATGGSHAAAAFTIDGAVISVMEDIGRHNAVDKVIGFLVESELLDTAAVLCVSGRISYEIVAKAHRARIPFLAAVSAPSTFAVELCRSTGMTLLAFCRGNRATVYAHGSAVVGREPIET